MKTKRFNRIPIKRIRAINHKGLIILPFVAVLITFSLTNCETLVDPDEPGNLVPKTVVEDPLLPRIEVNGTFLHAESFGDIHDPVIIFLHGGPGSDYRAFISQTGIENASRYPSERNITNGGLSQLQDEYYCVFYDQRGAGLSPRFEPGEVDFDIYLADLDAVIDYYLQKKANETGIVDDQVYLLGWSYGGILSTGYINRYPERVKDVVMYETGPFTREAWDYFIENTTSVFGQLGEDWLEGYLLSHEHITPDTHERADYKMILGAFQANPEFHENTNTPMWRVGAFIGNENLDFSQSDNYDITSNLINFQGRLLLIGGEFTANEYPGYLDLQLPLYPNAEYTEIPGVGHTGPWEKPDEIATLIRDFFSE
jgi:proline iminopeptidase